MSLSNLFRYSGFKAFTTKMQVPLKQKTFFKWQGKTMQDILDECFTNEDLKAVVSQFWVYYGAPVPDETAVLLLMANNTYLKDGPVHVMGTSQNLSNAYAERIEELGGTVKTGTLVTEIIIEDGLARGVKTEYGDVYTARYIVANTDPYQLIYKLIGQENLPKKYVDKVKNMKVANSLFGVYLGLNIDLKKFGHKDTEIFYNTSLDSAAAYDNMMKGNFKEGAVSITIYSNYGDPVYAPKGKSVLVLHAFSDYNIWAKDKKEYQKMKEEKAWELINLAANAIPEIKEKRYIEEMEVITPVTINEYTLNHEGIIYGFYMDKEQWQKIPIRTPIDNVFIASNWTSGFHGFGSAQINGWMANRLIMDIEGLEYK
ncbi:MAG: NAD(P)/FAD-dependent oxidoreductase [Deltaproteobacteria bacterium]|uniref:NAD(P)/FAD-dependent oxidoreductase n=1 Tax=Candidatus Zymogenus saltonus TaxID=2844893 RepID=A0A9D8PNX5_9DELT|nr:NAD(P)/FAD-dependent oxidoreductase [Candidatus Zymogenus saltonus]